MNCINIDRHSGVNGASFESEVDVEDTLMQ
jgi:hypothetical protein